IDNRRIPFDRSIAEGLMPSESEISPVRPVFKEIDDSEVTRNSKKTKPNEPDSRFYGNDGA
ncbi:hypothetical protein, partial [Neisseria meningitidis]|uniref:hypothetical protein n=1 Tax=Neisseria meningitidis TaxID=487 RepID=UPI001E4AB9D4